MILERRISKRYEAGLPVQVRYVDNLGKNETKLSVSSITVSESGLSILSKNVPLPLVPIRLTLSLPKPYQQVVLTGKIVWRRLLPKQNEYLCGVALSRDNEEMLDILNTYLRTSTVDLLKERRNLGRRAESKPVDAELRKWDRRGQSKLFEKASRFVKRMDQVKSAGLYFYLRPLESPNAAHVVVNGQEMIMFGSNNYLGLTTHPKVKKAAIKAIEKYGAGAGAVRLLGGTLNLHNELEEKLAAFKGTDAAIAYSAGYTANIATVSCLLSTKQDVAVIDEKDHASIIDGCRLANATMRVFAHNDMSDLQSKLEAIPDECNKFIIVDGVFSMDGDIANLMEIYRLAKRHNATVMIDEAHATGVIGKRGRGTPEHFGLEGRIDIVMGTLSKAFGGIGGFVASTKTVVDYLKHSARAFVFSSALPPAICASVIAAIEVIETEPEHIQRLHENENLLRNGLQQLGFNTGLSSTAIIPVLIGDEMKTYQMVSILQKAGIYVSPVARPAVKRGGSRLRVSVMATHTHEDIMRALDAFEKAGKSLAII